MKTIAAALLTLCLSLVVSQSFAQASASLAAKRSMSLQDCQDRSAMAKGEKRSDGSVDKGVEKQCADLLKAEKKRAMRANTKKDHEAAQTDNIPGANTTSKPMK